MAAPVHNACTTEIRDKAIPAEIRTGLTQTYRWYYSDPVARIDREIEWYTKTTVGLHDGTGCQIPSITSRRPKVKVTWMRMRMCPGNTTMNAYANANMNSFTDNPESAMGASTRSELVYKAANGKDKKQFALKKVMKSLKGLCILQPFRLTTTQNHISEEELARTKETGSLHTRHREQKDGEPIKPENARRLKVEEENRVGNPEEQQRPTVMEKEATCRKLQSRRGLEAPSRRDKKADNTRAKKTRMQAREVVAMITIYGHGKSKETTSGASSGGGSDYHIWTLKE
ncbi:hypothetical protein K438DRAFT_2111234 [Mycena galopus ATCC 62051]|nr:hypothetical protein K438DRAFT_2111234 [Mycena galopus ATCC 62051]